jgi:drug/metabolite transporter (DMT)-like permease
VVLAYTTPLWVAPGAAVFLGERPGARRFAGVLLGFAGIGLMFNLLAFDWPDRASLVGNGALLLAAFFWAGNILHIRAHRWTAAPFDLVVWDMALASAIIGGFAVAIDGWPRIEWTPNRCWLLLYSALPGSAIAYWGVAARNLPTVTTSLGLLGASVIGIAASAVMFGETPSVMLLVAVMLIMGGIVLGVVSSR